MEAEKIYFRGITRNKYTSTGQGKDSLCIPNAHAIFKAFQLPLRKEATDTEIGRKQQVILWYILKRKTSRLTPTITMSTLTPARQGKQEMAVFIDRNR